MTHVVRVIHATGRASVGAIALAGAIACRPAPEPEPAGAGALARSSATTTPIPPIQPGSSSSPRAAEAPLDEDCTAGVDWTTERAALVEELERNCIAGQKLLVTPSNVKSGDTLTFQVDDVTRCLRVLASGDKNVESISLTLLRETRELAAYTLARRALWLGARGPVCVAETGTYGVRVQSSPPVALEVRVWQTL